MDEILLKETSPDVLYCVGVYFSVQCFAKERFEFWQVFLSWSTWYGKLCAKKEKKNRQNTASFKPDASQTIKETFSNYKGSCLHANNLEEKVCFSNVFSYASEILQRNILVAW